MPEKTSLFRSEVLRFKTVISSGQILLIYPPSGYVFAGLSLLILTIIASLGIFGKYTRTADVGGALEPASGLVRIGAPQSGTVQEIMVHAGQAVKKGDVLMRFVRRSENADGISLERDRENAYRTRIEGHRNQLAASVRLIEARADGVVAAKRNIEESRELLKQEVEIVTARVASAQAAYDQFDRMRTSGFISAAQMRQRSDDLLEQQARLQVLQRNLVANQLEISRAASELRNHMIGVTIAKEEYRRQISTLEGDHAIQKHQSGWTLVSPTDGIVSALNIKEHQEAREGTLLANISKNNSPLEALLYAPSKDIGFLRPGLKVRLRIDAFPYQKFGLVTGEVQAITGSPTAPTEIFNGNSITAGVVSSESVYTIRVSLNKNHFNAQGRRLPLAPGMKVRGKVELETRYLYEWALAPLYSLQQ